jgi:hypothetical protein
MHAGSAARRIAITASALGAIAAATSTPAHAATHSVETFGFSTPAQGQLSSVCGYPVAMVLEGSWNIVTFTGDDGSVTKQIRTYRFTAELSANGVTITGRSRGPEVVEHHADGTSTMTAMGVVSRQVRGAGTVMQAAGRVVVELDADGEQVGEPTFQAGQAEDPSEVCAAFE